MRYIVVLCVLSLFLTACGSGGGGGSSTPTHSSGAHLSFAPTVETAHAAAAMRVAAAAAPTVLAADPVTADYEMGNLNKTSTYLFILKNDGTEPAQDVQLSCDNPNVTMVPSVIGVLSPVSAGGVQPVIQVTVQHGFNANGIGTAPTLTPGRLTFTIQASIDSTVSASAVLGMTVKSTNFTMHAGYLASIDGNAECTQTNSEGVVSRKTNSSYGTVTATQWSLWTPTYWGANTPPSGDSALQLASIAPIEINNTGNTNVYVDIYRGWGTDESINYMSLVSSETIPAGTNLDITPQIVTQGTGQMAWTMLRVHGDGAVFNSTGNFQPDTNADVWLEVMTGTGYVVAE